MMAVLTARTWSDLKDDRLKKTENSIMHSNQQETSANLINSAIKKSFTENNQTRNSTIDIDEYSICNTSYKHALETNIKFVEVNSAKIRIENLKTKYVVLDDSCVSPSTSSNNSISSANNNNSITNSNSSPVRNNVLCLNSNNNNNNNKNRVSIEIKKDVSDSNNNTTPVKVTVSDNNKSNVVQKESKECKLPKPEIVLYSSDLIELGWKKDTPVGAGFFNLGNTCYLNSTLQALFHTPSFVNWLLNDKTHQNKCTALNGLNHSACTICAMAKTLNESLSSNFSPIKPTAVYSKLKSICKHLNHGNQEDAHEFLRYLIESMEKCYLNSFANLDKFDQYTKETTPLNQIFGGYLRNEVTCLECRHVSTTFQHFQDLLIDIRQASTLKEALSSFFSNEKIGGTSEFNGESGNYKCSSCKNRVAATKKFSIERAPKVLCIQLKRFNVAGSKNSKHIELYQRISLNSFKHSQSSDGDIPPYQLVAMVQHIGTSTSCGHYTAIGSTSDNTYYLFDDSSVKPVSAQHVLNVNAYILFYEQIKIPDNTRKSETIPAKLSNQNNHKVISSTNNSIIRSPKLEKLGVTITKSSPQRTTQSTENSNQLQISLTKTSSSTLLTSPSTSKLSINTTKFTPNKQLNNANCNIIRNLPEVTISKRKFSDDSNSDGQFAKKTCNNSAVINPSLVSYSLTDDDDEEEEEENDDDEDWTAPIDNDEKCEEIDIDTSFNVKEDTNRKEKRRKNNEDSTDYSTANGFQKPEKVHFNHSKSKHCDIATKTDSTNALNQNSRSGFAAAATAALNRISNKEFQKFDNTNNDKIKTPPSVIEENEKEKNSSKNSIVCANGKWAVGTSQDLHIHQKAETNLNTTSENSSQNSSNNKTSWDGKSKTEAAEYLSKLNHQGYNGTIKTWCGKSSELEVTSDREKENRKFNSYDDDYDRGRTKRYRIFKNKNRTQPFQRSINMFQEFQNHRNQQQQQRWIKSNGGGSFKNRRHGNHKHNNFYNRNRNNYNGRY